MSKVNGFIVQLDASTPALKNVLYKVDTTDITRIYAPDGKKIQFGFTWYGLPPATGDPCDEGVIISETGDDDDWSEKKCKTMSYGDLPVTGNKLFLKFTGGSTNPVNRVAYMVMAKAVDA